MASKKVKPYKFLCPRCEELIPDTFEDKANHLVEFHPLDAVFTLLESVPRAKHLGATLGAYFREHMGREH